MKPVRFLNQLKQGLSFTWVTVINEIFKFPSHLDPFGKGNYLYEFSSGYPNYPT